MAIYKPVSNLTRRAAAVGGSVLGGLSSALGAKIGSAFGGSALGRAAGGLVQKGLNTAASEASRRLGNKAANWAQRADDKISRIARKKLKTFGLNAFENEVLSREAVHFTGGLSVRQIWENYKKTDVDSLSRKNFYLLEVNDRTNAAPVSDGSRHSQFNLLATSLSFTAFDIQGEGVPVGAVELDKPSASPRTVMNLTMLDDQWGTVKRWAEQKALMIASSDGTFLPPSYYVFDVRVVFGTNIPDEAFYEQIYTMRVQSMPHELSRTEQGLEEIQLTFCQADTFMPHWI